jgi:hypothetical protein
MPATRSPAGAATAAVSKLAKVIMRTIVMGALAAVTPLALAA